MAQVLNPLLQNSRFKLKKVGKTTRTLRYAGSTRSWGFPRGSDGKESACSAGDPGSIPGLGRSPGEGSGNSSTLAWKIPWTEEPGGLQSMGSQRVRHD